MRRWEGPWFRWYAWHPAFTRDRGWRWLRTVWRRRETMDVDMVGSHDGWAHSVGDPR